MAKARVMQPKESRKPLTADDIQEGKTYRGKNPRRFLGGVNDRLVLHITAMRTKVQYDSSAVKDGSHYPFVTMEQFLKWASHEVF